MFSTVLVLSVTLGRRTAIITGLIAVYAASVRAVSLTRTLCPMVWSPDPWGSSNSVKKVLRERALVGAAGTLYTAIVGCCGCYACD